jgi:hypothetical protein
MRVLAVDLASSRARDLGIVVLQSNRSGLPKAIPEDPAALSLKEPLSALELAQALFYLSAGWSCNAIALDGPQAWKDPGNNLLHSRLCDRAVNAPAKIGLPGEVKPRTYLAFSSFSIRVFDYLDRLGRPRLSSRERPIDRAMEIFPLAAWRSLGLKPLPAKSKCSAADLEQRWRDLCAFVEVPFHPTHDQLQAVVAGLGALRLTEGGPAKMEGQGPFLLDGEWREGWIVLP